MAEAPTIQVDIVSAEGELFSGPATVVFAAASQGDIGIYPRHAPLLSLLKPGEVRHVHFQDVPDMPRELLDMTTRVPPGDGVTPLVAILKKLAAKGYSGPLSVELFAPKYTQADPFAVASELKPKAEAVMKNAGVL